MACRSTALIYDPRLRSEKLITPEPVHVMTEVEGSIIAQQTVKTIVHTCMYTGSIRFLFPFFLVQHLFLTLTSGSLVLSLLLLCSVSVRIASSEKDNQPHNPKRPLMLPFIFPIRKKWTRCEEASH
jgi:hypothetical protein